MPVTQKPALDDALASLIRGTHRDPFAVLGPHADSGAIVVRAFQPAARSIELRLVATGALVPMEKRDPAGLFEVRLEPDTTGAGHEARIERQIRAGRRPAVSGFSRTVPTTVCGSRIPAITSLEIDDPYRYGRVLTDFDLHLLERRHALPRLREARRASHRASARRPACTSRSGRRTPIASASSATSTAGTAASRRCGCSRRAASGRSSSRICRTARSTSSRSAPANGAILKKTDPFGVAFEVPPQTASIVRDISRYDVARRRLDGGAPGARRVARRPMAIYEVHLGSWARVPEEGNRFLTYRELAHAARAVREGDGLHAHRAAAGDGASVLRIVGLSGARASSRRPAASVRRKTSSSSSTPAIRPASA